MELIRKTRSQIASLLVVNKTLPDVAITAMLSISIDYLLSLGCDKDHVLKILISALNNLSKAQEK
jgi:hypothetical protein